MNHVMQASKHRLRDQCGVVHGSATEYAHQDVLNARAGLAVVTVTGKVDQGRDETAVVIRPQVSLGLPALLKMQHRSGNR